jgi:DNA repair protein RecO (recombination protein O)
MSGLYRDKGVVLRTIKLGEADRIVTFLTQARGKVRAVAKGVRRPGSRFGARLEPTSHVALQCYQGRELDVVTQVETIDSNRALREHYGCLTHAVSMLEAVDQVAQERERNTALYRMLTGALRTLADDPSPIVSAAFFWKLLALEGFQPILDACARCGSEDGPFVAFDLDAGGVL